MFHAQASSKATLGTTGVKTLIDTITLPSSAKKIVGVWATALGGATLTTGQPISGIFEFESPDVAIQPMQFPLDMADVLTSGALELKPTIIPVDVALPNVAARISGYITLDLTNTGVLQGRFGILTD